MNAVDDAAAVLGPVARRDVPLGPLTTYRVGGPAALFVEITDDAVLRLVSGACRASGLPVLVVGRGSNLLVSERGFSGIAIVRVLNRTKNGCSASMISLGVSAGRPRLEVIISTRL